MCLQSTDKARVSSMVVTPGDACAYMGDQPCGIVHVYDIEEQGLQGQELQPPGRHEALHVRCYDGTLLQF